MYLNILIVIDILNLICIYSIHIYWALPRYQTLAWNCCDRKKKISTITLSIKDMAPCCTWIKERPSLVQSTFLSCLLAFPRRCSITSRAELIACLKVLGSVLRPISALKMCPSSKPNHQSYKPLFYLMQDFSIFSGTSFFHFTLQRKTGHTESQSWVELQKPLILLSALPSQVS